MELADILSEESVIVCTGLTTKAEVLELLANKAAAAAGADPAAVLRAVSEREELGSTGLGAGVAVAARFADVQPHRTNGAHRAYACGAAGGNLLLSVSDAASPMALAASTTGVMTVMSSCRPS